MLKVGDSFSRASAVISGQGFYNDGHDAHAYRSALQSLRDVHVC